MIGTTGPSAAVALARIALDLTAARRHYGAYACAAIIALFTQVSLAATAPSALKVLIAVDMEGVGGVVTGDQLNPSGFEYDRFRRFMTNEALAAVRAATAAGAGTIVVTDSHGNGQNLLIEDFPRDVRIVRSWPRQGAIVAGIDSSFDAVVLIGFHAGSTSPAGVRAHTWSSSQFTRVALNGRDVSEGMLAAAQAGALGVPTVFISGDDATTAELREVIPDIGTVDTKKALGFHSALVMPPAESEARIESGVRSALARARQIRPYVIAAPVAVEIGYKHYAAAEVMGYLPGAERIGSRTIRYVAQDIEGAASFIEFAAAYRADLAP
jgi:D-amino peptidase